MEFYPRSRKLAGLVFTKVAEHLDDELPDSAVYRAATKDGLVVRFSCLSVSYYYASIGEDVREGGYHAESVVIRALRAAR